MNTKKVSEKAAYTHVQGTIFLMLKKQKPKVISWQLPNQKNRKQATQQSNTKSSSIKSI